MPSDEQKIWTIIFEILRSCNYKSLIQFNLLMGAADSICNCRHINSIATGTKIHSSEALCHTDAGCWRWPKLEKLSRKLLWNKVARWEKLRLDWSSFIMQTHPWWSSCRNPSDVRCRPKSQMNLLFLRLFPAQESIDWHIGYQVLDIWWYLSTVLLLYHLCSGFD